MVVEFKNEKSNYRSGIALSNETKVKFTISTSNCENELLILGSSQLEESFVIKLIEVLLMGSYTRIVYKGIKYFRTSNVQEVMKLAQTIKQS